MEFIKDRHSKFLLRFNFVGIIALFFSAGFYEAFYIYGDHFTVIRTGIILGIGTGLISLLLIHKLMSYLGR